MTALRTAPSPSGPRTSDHLVVWRFFCRRFLAAYSTGYPWEGAGRPWPKGTTEYALDAVLPSAESNAKWLERIIELAGGDVDTACIRIGTLFANEEHRREGISLARVAGWFEHARTNATLEARTRLLMGSKSS